MSWTGQSLAIHRSRIPAAKKPHLRGGCTAAVPSGTALGPMTRPAHT